MADWKTLNSRIAYENPYIYVEENQVINPGGKETIYGIVNTKSNGGVFIVPVDNAGNTYIVRQFRYTKKKMSWECIAGRADEPNLEAAAKRELREEATIIADSLTLLGTIDMANGATTFTGTVFLAENLTKTHEELDENDGILELKKLPFETAIDMIMSGEIQCSESIAAFFMAREYIQRRN